MTPKDHVITYLEKQSKLIASLAPKVFRHLGQTSVHRLRVATRRARAALWILRQGSARIHTKKLNHCIRRLEKSLGRVRELDVAILDASRYRIDSSKLIIQRKKMQRKLQKLIRRGQIKNLSKEFSSIKKNARSSGPNSLQEARDKLRAQLNGYFKEDIHGKTGLHRLRVTMKKTRYALEAMGRPVDAIKPLQDILGDAHDLEILQALTKKSAKIKGKRQSLSAKAIRLVKPALRYAIVQLGKVI